MKRLNDLMSINFIENYWNGDIISLNNLIFNENRTNIFNNYSGLDKT